MVDLRLNTLGRGCGQGGPEMVVSGRVRNFFPLKVESPLKSGKWPLHSTFHFDFWKFSTFFHFQTYQNIFSWLYQREIWIFFLLKETIKEKQYGKKWKHWTQLSHWLIKKYGESGGEIIHSTPLSTLIFGLFPLSTPLSTLVYEFFPLATPLST